MDIDIEITWQTGSVDHTILHNANDVLLEYELTRLRSRPEVAEVKYTDDTGEHAVFKREYRQGFR